MSSMIHVSKSETQLSSLQVTKAVSCGRISSLETHAPLRFPGQCSGDVKLLSLRHGTLQGVTDLAPVQLAVAQHEKHLCTF